MKQVNLLLSCFILITSTAAIASTPQLDFVGRIANRINYAEQHQQAVWPGFHPAMTSTVIQFNMDDEQKKSIPPSAYALNFQPGKLHWEKLTVSNTPVYFLADSTELQINKIMLREIDGSNSYADIEKENFVGNENLFPSVIADRAAQYLIHESSIDQQHAKYLKSSYDFFSPTLLKLLYLEDAALTLSQQADTARAEDALRDAVAIHQYRSHLIPSVAREYENGNEIMNGIPIYIGWTSQQLNDDDYRKMTQRTGCSPLNAIRGAFGMIDCMLTNFPVYATSVYGHALDKKADANIWKLKVEKEFVSPWHQLAFDYYKFSDDLAKTITDGAMQKPAYDYKRIAKIVDATMVPYLKSLDVAKTKYINTPGIEFHTPYSFGFSLLFINAFEDNNVISNMYIADNNTFLFEDINLDDQSSFKASNQDNLSFKHLPFMSMNVVTKGFEFDEDNSYTSFKLSDNAQLVMDDTTMTASEFVRNKMVKSMHNLTISDQYTHIVLTSQDLTLDASDGVIKLKVNQSSMMSRLPSMPLRQWLHENINHETGLLMSNIQVN